ncbi:MAG TPA: ATP-binding protein [Treponemataceae bacterium]|nr:ATP-binding protein [Treponemataceae bacterium]
MPDRFNGGSPALDGASPWPEQADRDRVLTRFLGLGERFSVKSYYPQLQARVKDLEEKSTALEATLAELIKTKAALTRMNESLEEKVRERTRALEETVHRLKEAQEALIVSEKLATYGRVSTGIAHDLNSPLGAIASSATSFDSLINDLFERLESLMEKCPGRSIRLICEYLPQTARSRGQELSRIDRSRLKALTQTLERRGIPDAPWLAELAVDLALDARLPELIDELGAAETRSFFAVLGDILGLYRSREVLSLGVQKASDAIKKLRNLDMDADGENAVPLTDRVSLDACIQRALSAFDLSLHPRLTLNLPPASGLFVRSEEAALSKALVMLLENAFQAVRYEGRVAISLDAHERAVDILIKDNGCGIAPEIIDRIWDPFFTTKAPGEGAGFGLVFVRRTIERSGGWIRAQSVPGETCFTIEIPRYREGGVL